MKTAVGTIGFDYYEDKLRSGKSNPISVLVEAFKDLHKEEVSFGRMGKIYKDCLRDPYFILKGIWDTKDAEVTGQRINYLAGTLKKRLGQK